MELKNIESLSPSLPTWFSIHMEKWRDKTNVPQGDKYPFNHPTDFQNYLGLHQNDYLRLSDNPLVVEARLKATSERGASFLASTVYSGSNKYHSQLRKLLALSMKSEDSVLTSSGWAGNVGLIDSLADKKKPIYIDQKAHASLWDGARLSGAKVIPVRHNSPSALELKILQYGPGIVCIDSFYSATGSIAPLKSYVEICEKHDCLLVLDEAHSFAILGENGGGLAVAEGLAERIPIRTISFSKGLGGFGGAIACSSEMAWWLIHRSHSIIFSSSVMPTESAANIAALKIVMNNPDLGKRCLQFADMLRENLNDNGIDTGDSACQIVSISFDSGLEASNFYHEMKKRGVLTSVFLYPAVTIGTGLVRMSVYSSLTSEDISYIAHSAIESMQQLRPLSYRGIPSEQNLN